MTPTAMGPVLPVDLTDLMDYVFDKMNSPLYSMLYQTAFPVSMTSPAQDAFVVP